MASTLVFMTTPVTRLNISTTQLPSINKNPTFSVRCMSSQLPNDAGSTSKTPSSSPPTPMDTTPPPPPPALKVSTKFNDVLAFNGPTPERINGRLAMIGFVSAMAVELSNGQGLLTQISNGGVTIFVGTSVLLSLASLVPLFKGVSVQSKSNGIMTSDAELWNERFAMLGLVGLAFTEFVTGNALV